MSILLAGLVIIIRGTSVEAASTNLPSFFTRSLQVNSNLVIVAPGTSAQVISSNGIATVTQITNLQSQISAFSTNGIALALATAQSNTAAVAILETGKVAVAVTDALGTQKWDRVSGLASNAQRVAEIGGLQGFTNSFTSSGVTVSEDGIYGVIATIDGRTLFIVGGTNYHDFTRAALSLGADVQLYAGATGNIDFFTGAGGGTNRCKISPAGLYNFFGHTLSNAVVKANTLSLGNGQACNTVLTDGTSSNGVVTALVTAKAMEEALTSGRATTASTITRYAANVTADKQIIVTATGTGVVANIVGTGINFTIPSGTRLLSARLRWPGTAGTTITLDLGTTDMGNTGLTDRWGCTAAVYREDTGALISTAVPRLVTGTHDQIEITGLNSSQINHIVIGF